MHTRISTPPSTQIPIAVTCGDYLLSGVLHLPPGAGPVPLIVGCHGLLSTGNSPKQIVLADRCAGQGLAYFRFDHRGCGASEGDLHAATTFAGRSQDLLCVVEMLLERSDLRRPLGLFGSSFGGAVCLGCASDLAPAAVATLAAPIASAGIATEAVQDLLATEPYPGALNRSALEFDLGPRVAAISHLLVIHGSEDEVVPFDNAVRIHAAALSPKKLLELPGGDHRISGPAHQQTFLASALDWFRTYMM
ncbi:MAG: alpha/beta hydrolase [Desulfosarcinaceae bacterium]